MNIDEYIKDNEKLIENFSNNELMGFIGSLMQQIAENITNNDDSLKLITFLTLNYAIYELCKRFENLENNVNKSPASIFDGLIERLKK